MLKLIILRQRKSLELQAMQLMEYLKLDLNTRDLFNNNRYYKLFDVFELPYFGNSSAKTRLILITHQLKPLFKIHLEKLDLTTLYRSKIFIFSLSHSLKAS